MKTINPHTLITDKPREVEINIQLLEIFNIWKNQFETRTKKCHNELDVFIAGYCLANPVLREKYKKLIPKSDKEYELKFN